MFSYRYLPQLQAPVVPLHQYTMRRLVTFSVTSSVSLRWWQPSTWILVASRMWSQPRLLKCWAATTRASTSACFKPCRGCLTGVCTRSQEDHLSYLPATQSDQKEEGCITRLKHGNSRKRASSRARSKISRRGSGCCFGCGWMSGWAGWGWGWQRRWRWW